MQNNQYDAQLRRFGIRALVKPHGGTFLWVSVHRLYVLAKQRLSRRASTSCHNIVATNQPIDSSKFALVDCITT